MIFGFTDTNDITDVLQNDRFTTSNEVVEIFEEFVPFGERSHRKDLLEDFGDHKQILAFLWLNFTGDDL